MTLLVVLAGCATVQRTDTIDSAEPVESIGVTVTPAEAVVGWMVRVQNNREDTIRLSWDESTYTNVAGYSSGRLLRGETRKIDSGREQPASPIAPHAVLVEFAVPEQHVPYLERGVAPGGGAGVGHLRLVFETEDGKQTWVGNVNWKQ